MQKNLFWIIFLLIISQQISAQHKSSFASDSIFNAYSNKYLDDKTPFFIIKRKDQNQPLPCNFTVVRNISSSIAIIKKDYTKISCKESNNNFKIAGANNTWKLSPALDKKIYTKEELQQRGTFILSSFSLRKMINKWDLNSKQLSIKKNIPHSNAVIIQCSPHYLLDYLLADSLVFFIDEYVSPSNEIELIGYDRSQHGIELLENDLPDVNGKNITIGIKESDLNETDIDIQQRVKPSSLKHHDKDAHATVVAALAGGAGNSFITSKGLAWKSTFYPSSYNNLFPDAESVLLQNNVSVQNHSYGTVIQSFYGAEAAAYDAQAYGNFKNPLHVFSSGNKGSEASLTGTYRGIAGFANLTGNFKMSKNVITVGAMDTGMNIIAFSSGGPLYDGRLAPQIVALGPNGTSDAAAIVSGAVAALQQMYKDSNNQELPATSLVKALLFNNATDIDKKGIDYRSGYGSLDIFKAAHALQQKYFAGASINNNETWNYTLSIPPQAANLKVTLVWTDTAAFINDNKALVNDLDLEVTETISNTIYLPWVLSHYPSADSLNMPAIRKKDSLNNTEQISIDLPAGQSYSITVKGSRISTSGKQLFYISYNWDTLNNFRFTSPAKNTRIDKEENPFLAVKWNSITASPLQKGNLFLNMNNGTNWQQIATGISLSDKKFNWMIPDTTGVVVFRMDCSLGSFYSTPVTIAPLTKLKVDYFCTDSIQLSWNKHPYAFGYQLYLRTDSAYLKAIAFTTATSIVALRTNNLSPVYAVQPILSNTGYAARSAAIEAGKQGILCYYSTLLGSDDGNTINLQLTATLPQETDSIIFEKLNRNGSFLRRLSRQTITANQTVYNAKDTQRTVGTNYYRAVIYTKNNRSVYTTTTTVMSNVNEAVFLYPNPVKRNQILFFKLKNLVNGYKFQLIDAMGKIKLTESIGLQGTIATNTLPAGIYLYRIIKPDKTSLASGKIIITL